MFVPGILTALIGAISAFCIMAVRDVAMNILKERRTGRQYLLQCQIEQAYAPLEYLVIMLLQAEEAAQKASLIAEIGLLLRQHSYLLSERTVSAVYTLLDDEEAGAYFLQQHFFTEFEELKRLYYRAWFVSSRARIQWHWPFHRSTPQGGVNFQTLIQ